MTESRQEAAKRLHTLLEEELKENFKMARPSCMKDVWDAEYQELLVIKHAHETQTLPTEWCDDKHPTGEERIGDTKRFDIK